MWPKGKSRNQTAQVGAGKADCYHVLTHLCPHPTRGFLGKPPQGEPLDLGNFPLHRLPQERCRWPTAWQSETMRTEFQTGMASWSGPGTNGEKEPPPTVFLFF